ncbi:MAG: hypothetical protein LBQ09_03145 [Acidobacteriaceae bacterium]|jgi:hypothetical protein|nr:hypothetical protein [Acidobacteriaceae bacterium]
MKARIFASAFILCAVTGLAPVTAFAQQPSGGLQITQIKDGWLVAPDVRFTSVDHRSATLLGGYGGYEIDRTLLIGGAAYWLVNRQNDFNMQYGGVLARWTIGGYHAVSVSPGILLGGGDAMLTRPYADVYGPPTTDRRGRPLPQPSVVLVRDGFTMAEPQVNALIHLAPRVSIDAGVGYRFIGTSYLLRNTLEGVSGSLALRFSY